MELRHLRYFVAVAELGSFSRAAQALSIAQPPLSTQIRDLEAEIGAPLLVRHVRGVSLTPAGETVLQEARDILARAERLKLEASRDARATGGILNIGFITSASHFLLPQVLPALRRRYPDLVVRVREMLSSEQLAALQTGTLDAAICRPPVRAKSLRVAAELSDPFCLAVPTGHPLARTDAVQLQAAAAADFIAFKRDQERAFFDQTLNFCTDAGFSPAIRCEASTAFGVLDLVAAGLGVAIVPASCAGLAGSGVVLCRLVRPTRPGAILLACRNVDRNPAVMHLAALVRTAFRRLQSLVERRLARQSTSDA